MTDGQSGPYVSPFFSKGRHKQEGHDGPLSLTRVQLLLTKLLQKTILQPRQEFSIFSNSDLVFDPRLPIFELIQVITGIYVLTMFRDNRSKNVTTRVLTSKFYF